MFGRAGCYLYQRIVTMISSIYKIRVGDRREHRISGDGPEISTRTHEPMMYNDVVTPIEILFDVVERNPVNGCSVINKHLKDNNMN